MAIGNVLRFGAAGAVGYGVYQVGKKAYEHKDEIKQKAIDFKNNAEQKLKDFNDWQKENREKLSENGLVGKTKKYINEYKDQVKENRRKTVEEYKQFKQDHPVLSKVAFGVVPMGIFETIEKIDDAQNK